MLNSRRQGQVAILTIDRSYRRNALGSELMRALEMALLELEDDAGVAAVVISGTAPGFCAGSDLKELAAMTIPQMCRHEAETARIVRMIGFMAKPAVAAVSGFALGGGVGLAAGCDLIVTHAECRWHMPEVPNGWLPPRALEAIAQRVGQVTARRLVWASEPITGTEAHALKLADYLVPQNKVECEAIALGERLAALPRVAVASTKRFFAPLVNGRAEASDMLANRIFAENCQDEASKATLRKFGMRANTDEVMRHEQVLFRERGCCVDQGRPDGRKRRRHRMDHARSRLKSLAARFVREGHPCNLTFYFPRGTGDGIGLRGMDHVAIEGLMKRIVSGS
jgi:enoyl-CoA hydratase/carnithine racemase